MLIHSHVLMLFPMYQTAQLLLHTTTIVDHVPSTIIGAHHQTLAWYLVEHAPMLYQTLTTAHCHHMIITVQTAHRAITGARQPILACRTPTMPAAI